MADTPERVDIPQPVQAPESGVVNGGQELQPTNPERPETYLEKLERHGAQVIPNAPQPVTDDGGQQLTQPAPSNVTTVNIPANQVQILEWAKGPPESALTWLARYWIRLMKKSVHFGWRLIMPPPPVPIQPPQVQTPPQTTQLPDPGSGVT